MFIIGNTETYSEIPMWHHVINLLQRGQNVGPKLPLCCPRHPETAIEVAGPDDFSRLAPEGGCALPCRLRLGCGHACTFKCHSQSRHEAVVCQEACPRRRDTCDHACPRKCGERCDMHCNGWVQDVRLLCGHTATKLRCYQTQNLSKVECKEPVRKEVEGCGHLALVKCHQSTSSADFRCSEVCGSNLACGHQCGKLCQKCRSTVDEDGYVILDHKGCNTACGRPYTTCAHYCSARCHGESPCPLCSAKCQVSCNHSICGKKCQEPCGPAQRSAPAAVFIKANVDCRALCPVTYFPAQRDARSCWTVVTGVLPFVASNVLRQSSVRSVLRARFRTQWLTSSNALHIEKWI